MYILSERSSLRHLVCVVFMETSSWFLLFSFLVFIGDVAVSTSVSVPSQVRAMFVFGDSLLDPGNNNNLFTAAKANYYPHGIDFSQGTTGRFCNGGTIADHLSTLVGLGILPAFNNPNTKGTNVLRGANFASSASGLLNDTGVNYGDRFPMDAQLEGLTEKILPEMARNIGDGTTMEEYLAKSLVYSNMGSNDFITNYLVLTSYEPTLYTLPEYHNHLIDVYIRQLKELYNLGVKKFLISGLAPLGCTPSRIAGSPNYSESNPKCADDINQIAIQFSAKVKTMVHKLNKELVGAYFLYWDLYTDMIEVLNRSAYYGFKHVYTACCGAGRLNSIILCLPNVPFVCPNRSEYMFWDPFHPSDAVNAIIAKKAYSGKLQNMYPMNVQQLLQL
ncbi:hypothetical protein GIB67_043180 [Kingdonia uniflora]|uniref:GDSL esterase/lipase n=1 Tax=Kingdonia uniflora TaxID=39325 RepID=A0A7J7NJC2_9MAGN|nr:hypothetical protein GIB67_043180 [Kingdonia uniflora]